MSMNLDLFKECYQQANKAISQATKEELAESARLLPLNVAHYRQRYGELPLKLVDPETAQLLAEGMLQPPSGLAVVTGDREVFEKTEAMKEKLH